MKSPDSDRVMTNEEAIAWLEKTPFPCIRIHTGSRMNHDACKWDIWIGYRSFRGNTLGEAATKARAHIWRDRR